MATTFLALPQGVSDYFAAFDLTAIAVSRDRRLIVTRDSAGAEAAWWCEAKAAGAIVRRARADHGDIPAAAKALGMAATEHHVAVQRSADAVARIERALAEAQENGLMRDFNASYRARRQAAQAVGRGFMSYQRARARLGTAVAGIIARGGDLDLGAIRQVFD